MIELLSYILIPLNLLFAFGDSSILYLVAGLFILISVIVPKDEVMDMGAAGSEYAQSTLSKILFIIGCIFTLLA